jgi:diamine N-acetyltransferase
MVAWSSRSYTSRDRVLVCFDVQHQRRGYGREAVGLVTEIVRANGATELLTSYLPGGGEPEPFYRRIGFRPTGEMDENGEIILALKLGTV